MRFEHLYALFCVVAVSPLLYVAVKEWRRKR